MKKILNPPPIKVEIEDLEKNTYIVEAKIMTASDMDKIGEIVDPLNESTRDVFKIIIQQLIYIFGKDEKFWQKFSITVLRGLLDYFNKEIANPTLAT